MSNLLFLCSFFAAIIVGTTACLGGILLGGLMADALGIAYGSLGRLVFLSAVFFAATVLGLWLGISIAGWAASLASSWERQQRRAVDRRR